MTGHFHTTARDLSDVLVCLKYQVASLICIRRELLTFVCALSLSCIFVALDLQYLLLLVRRILTKNMLLSLRFHVWLLMEVLPVLYVNSAQNASN